MFLLYKHLKKQKKEKGLKNPPKRCAHQQNAVLESGRSLQPTPLANTEHAVDLATQVKDAPVGNVSVDKNSGEVSGTVTQEDEVGAPDSPCSECKAEKHAARRYRWLLIGGLFFPFTVQALDRTIVAGALPFIASDFHELAQINWIVSAFNLTSATFIPAWGQFADIFGRHAALQASLVLMVIGSALCAASPVTAFPMLLVGRALQGIGCAGLQINARIILSDKVSLKENAKNNTIFSLVGGIGYGIGPVIGGYLTEANWRWVFAINIPISIIGIVFGYLLLRHELLGPQPIPGVDDTSVGGRASFKARLSTIDYGGQFLFLFGMGLLVLALTWGGSYYPWSNVNVLAPLVIGAVLSILFLIWEFLMMPGRKLAIKFPNKMAMIPISLLWSRNGGLLAYINFITGMALFAVFYFVDIYFAIVQGYPPGRAGTQLLYYTPGLGVGAYLAMFCCNVWPRQTWFPLAFGTLVEPLGITLLAVAINWNNVPIVCGIIGFTGVGTGIRMMPGSLHGVGYFPTQIASIVSLVSLAVGLGGTFAMTLMFTVFNNSLSNAGIILKGGSSDSFDQIQALPADAQAYFRDRTKIAISTSFFALGAFLWLGLIAVAFLGNVNITKKSKVLDGDVRDFSENIIEGSYIGSWFKKSNDTAVRRRTVQPEAQEQDAEKGRGVVS